MWYAVQNKCYAVKLFSNHNETSTPVLSLTSHMLLIITLLLVVIIYQLDCVLRSSFLLLTSVYYYLYVDSLFKCLKKTQLSFLRYIEVW